jgi:hypothetical protein
MNKYIWIGLLCIGLISCQNKNSEAKTQDKESEDTILVEKKELTKPEETEVWEPKPKQIDVDSVTEIPSDALVLFDGSNFDRWMSSVDSTAVKWIINDEGSMTVKDKTGDIQTKQNFGDVQLYIEWRSDSENSVIGQNKSNSGVFLQNRYELQILDNNNNETYVNGQVGSVYKQSIPLAMVSSPTGKWNTYEIIYRQPIFDSVGNKIKSAYMTVLHNGVLIQDHFEIAGTTEYIGLPTNKPHGKAPIKLQDHQDNSGVSFRNIWVREL